MSPKFKIGDEFTIRFQDKKMPIDNFLKITKVEICVNEDEVYYTVVGDTGISSLREHYLAINYDLVKPKLITEILNESFNRLTSIEED